MARTIQEIQNQILAEKAVHPELAGLTSTSRVSIWRLWTYITAVAIHTLERLFDVFKKEVDQTIARAQIHTFLWYRYKALAFQYGQDLVVDKDYYDNTDLEEDVVLERKIVKHVAVVRKIPNAGYGYLEIKLAKEKDNQLVPMTAVELKAFETYMFRVADAGTYIRYISLKNDWLKLELDIYYDPLILSGNGSRKDGTENKPVKKAIAKFLRQLEFNGELILTKLTDHLQQVEGVKMPVIKAAYGSINHITPTSYEPINEVYRSLSGYMQLDLNNLDIKYKARQEN